MKRFPTITAVGLLLLGGTVAAHAQQVDPTVQLVDNWYRLFLGRPADQAGVNYWVPRVTSQGPQAALAGILASDEYYNRNGGTPQGMVLGLYRDVLNRTNLLPQDVDYWVNKAAQYGSREAMAQEFLHDANVNVTTLGGGAAVAPPPQPPAAAYAPPVYVTPRPTDPYHSEHHWHRMYHYRPW